MLSDKITLDIDIDDEYDYSTVFIDLKSESVKKYTYDQVLELIGNNGIVLKINNEWCGTDKSILSFDKIGKEELDKLIEIFNKYKTLFCHHYQSGTTYNLFVINKNLALDYYDKITKYYDNNYDITDLNIYLTINKKIQDNSIKNFTILTMNNYLYLNDLTVNKTKDFELVMPEDLSQIMIKLRDNETVVENEKNKIIKFKHIFNKLIEEKKDSNSIQIKVIEDGKLKNISPEDLNRYFEIIE